MNILVIEDNQKIADSLAELLRQNQNSASCCYTGAAGEDEAVNNKFDVVILDLMLPDRDGIEVCRNIRRRGVGTPILVVSALSDVSDKIQALDAGADDFITKPFKFPELMARLRAMTRFPTATEEILECDGVRLHLNTRKLERGGVRAQLGSCRAIRSERTSGTSISNPAATSLTSTSPRCAESWSRSPRQS